MDYLGGRNVITRFYKWQNVQCQRKRLEDAMLLALHMEERGHKLRKEECRQPQELEEPSKWILP